MMIDARESEILVRKIGELAQGVVDAGVAVVHALEELPQLLRVHSLESLVESGISSHR
jgi:hypothetical protein